MKKHYFLMMLLLLIGFTGRAMAQTMHTITVEYDKAAIKLMFMYNENYECIGNAQNLMNPVQVADGTRVTIEDIAMNTGYEITEVLVNDAPAKLNSTKTYLNLGEIKADTRVKFVTQKNIAETCTVNFAVKGETPKDCFLSVWLQNGILPTQLKSGDQVEKGKRIKISWGVSADYDVQVLVNGVPFSQEVIDSKYEMVTVDGDLNIEATFIPKAPVVTTHNITLVADPFTAGEVTMTSKGVAVGGGTSGNTVNHGDDLVISIKANQGNEIDDVLINGSSVKTELTDGENGAKVYTIASVEDDVLVNVNFKRISCPVTLNVTPAEGGAVTMMVGETAVNSGDAVAYGSNVILTFHAAEGYQLGTVMVNEADVTASVVEGTYTIENVQAEQNIVVTYVENAPVAQHNVTISTVGKGSLMLMTMDGVLNPNFTELTESFAEGTALGLVNSPAEGWILSSILLNDEDVTSQIAGGGLEFSVDQDVNIVVTFVEKQQASNFTITLTTEGEGIVDMVVMNGGGIKSGDTVKEGEDLMVYIYPSKDWNVVQILINEVDVTAEYKPNMNELKVANITENKNIVVKFATEKVAEYAVNWTIEGKGFLDVTVVDGAAIANGDKVAEGSDLLLSFRSEEDGDGMGNPTYVSSVLVNGVEMIESYDEMSNSLKIENVTTEMTIVVKFDQTIGIESNLAEVTYYDAAAQIFRVPAEAQVELYNITGTKVAEAQGDLNMVVMGRGLYLAKVSMAGKTAVVKILK